MNTEKIKPTQEEKDWVKALAEGGTNKGVAKQFGFNSNTFACKMAVVRGRFGVKNVVELVHLFTKKKYI